MLEAIKDVKLWVNQKAILKSQRRHRAVKAQCATNKKE